MNEQIAQKLAKLAQSTRISIKQQGGSLMIQSQGQTFEIKQSQSGIVRDQTARFR